MEMQTSVLMGDNGHRKMHIVIWGDVHENFKY